MQKIKSIIRSQEWWETKLSPLLAIGYATASFSGASLINFIPCFLFLLVSVIIGAVYVSVINDIADIDEDLASGKTNRMATIRSSLRWLIPVFCVLLGSVFVFFLYPDQLSILLYILPWISFSLYSFEPFRLKRRGVWGLFADASGSHLFISLLFVSAVSYAAGQEINWIWFTAVGVWAFSYGLRGILWHQFYDRDNDLKINLNTFATGIDPGSFKSKAIVLLLAELAAFVVMLLQISLFLPVLFLALYFFLVFIRYRWLGYRPIIIMTPQDQPFEILMLHYYQGFWPLSLLITAALTEPAAWVLCFVHILLFSKSLQMAARDGIRFIRKMRAVYVMSGQRLP